MTSPKHTSNPPSCRYPVGIGKSTAHDARDGDDDESQRSSKGVRELICVTASAEYHGPTNLSIYRPGRGEQVDGTLVGGPGALPLR